MILRTLVVGAPQTNCYLVGCERTQQAMILDPGADPEQILNAVGELDLRVGLIVLTHSHFDHALAVEPVRAETGAALAIHQAEAGWLTDPPALLRFFSPGVPRGIAADRLLDHGDRLDIGELTVEVLHTPGHSPGGISLWIATERVVFSGDALFRAGLGRTDFPGSSYEVLVQSIHERLFRLPEDTTVYPGHGPPTTIGYELRANPWVGIRRA